MGAAPRSYEFGEFHVGPAARRLWRRDGTLVPLTTRVFDTLLYLVEHRGVVLGKDELIAAIWPDRVVEENNLSQSISALRRAFHECDGDARYITTVPGRGYRFIGEALDGSGEIDGPAAVDYAKPLRRSEDPGACHAADAPVGQSRTATHAPLPMQVLAVLPFQPLVPEQRDETLVMGMAEVLIAKLSSSSALVVRPLSLTRRHDAAERDPLAVGSAVGADFVLDGGLQRDHARLRVTVRLLRVIDGTALWAACLDVDFTDVFDVQDTIAERVLEALAVRLGGKKRRELKRRETDNVNAYQCYLTGRHHIAKLTPPEILEGIAFFEKATALDPRYALAYAGAADAYRRLPIACDWRPMDAFPHARAAAQKALSIDETLADAHCVLGFVRFWYEWRWSEAEAAFRRAIESRPDAAQPHLGLAHLWSNLGRQREALGEIRRARELDPLSLIANTLEASFLSLGQRDEEALSRLQKAFDIDPDFWVAHLHLGNIRWKQGRTGDAISAFQSARILSGGVPHTLAALGYARARSADPASARDHLDELHALSKKRYVPPSNFALVHCGLEEADRAFAWLERAYAERDLRMTFLKVDRRWDELRDDPRFVDIVARMKLNARRDDIRR